MKRILSLFLAVNGLYTLLAPPVQAAEYEIIAAPSMPLKIVHAVIQPTTLIVENALGNVDLVEGSQHHFIVEGVSLGPVPLPVRLIESEKDKLTVKVEYPQAPIDIGKRPSGELASNALHLRITAPRDLLNHVKIESQIGHIKMEEPFRNLNVKGRKIILISDAGNIFVSRVSAGGGFQIKGQTGRVTLHSLNLAAGKIDSISGEITLDNVVARKLMVGNLNGPVSSTQGRGDIHVTTVAGLIDIRGHSKGQITASSQIGDVYLDNPDAVAVENASSATCEADLGPKVQK